MRSDGCKIRKQQGDVRLTIEQKHRRGPGCGSGSARQGWAAPDTAAGRLMGLFIVFISSRVNLVVYSVDM